MPANGEPMLKRSEVSEVLRPKPDCLTPEELETLVEKSASHPHLENCPRCQAELALLRSFESSEPLPDEGAAVAWISAKLEERMPQIKNPRSATAAGGTGSWLRSLFAGPGRWLVPALAMAIVAVVGFLVLNRPKEPELQADAGHGLAIYRSQEVQVIEPIGDLASAPEKLRWQAFSGAAEYQISIMEVDQAVLWSEKTDDLLLTIPATVRDKMLPGKPLLWQVKAVDSQGRLLATSQVQPFSVRRNRQAQ
jgi:hypothetical protein